MKTSFAGLFVVLAFAFTCHSATSATHYVWQESPSPGPPYDSWATAAHVIQDAVDEAMDGDTVLVTNGVYAMGGRAIHGNMTNRVAVDRAITLSSVNGPEVTSIEGYQLPLTPAGVNGDETIRCVYLTNGAFLNGFTLTNGATRGSGELVSEQRGGGLWCESTDAVASNCVITANAAAEFGGGAYSGTLVNCTLNENWARDGGGGSCDATLNNCNLMNNLATSNGGGSYGGILNNSVLRGNWSKKGDGGGAYGSTLNNCMLVGNLAFYNGGGSYGGMLNNCTLAGNSADGNETFTTRWDLDNGKFLLSATENNGGGSYLGTLKNCIVYFNSTTGSGDNYYGSTLVYSCTLPLPPDGLGNIDNPPLFLNADNWSNLRLHPDSPCIDAGTNLSGFVNADLDGKPRPLDGDGDGAARYDIGAYEYGVALEIAKVAGTQQAKLSWVATPGEVYALEETLSLTPPAWTSSLSGVMNPVMVDIEEPQNHWRLRQVLTNMVWIPPGTFTMGSPETEAERALFGIDETQHEVTISRGFWIGKFEVTQQEYQEVMGSNPSYWRNGIEGTGSGGTVTNETQHPVDTVNPTHGACDMQGTLGSALEIAI